MLFFVLIFSNCFIINSIIIQILHLFFKQETRTESEMLQNLNGGCLVCGGDHDEEFHSKRALDFMVSDVVGNTRSLYYHLKLIT